MPIAIGAQVKSITGPHNSRATPDSTKPSLGTVPEGSTGQVTAGPTVDTSGQTTNEYYSVNWSAQTVPDGWIVGGWLVVLEGSITGFVAEPTGARIAGATVAVQGGPMVTTPADGTFTIPPLAPKLYMVTASKAGYVAQTQQVAVAAETISTVTFQLAPQASTGGGLHGRVQEPTGVGLADVDVVATGGPEPLPAPRKTAVDGSYSFGAVPAGSYTINANKHLYIEQSKQVVVVTGQAVACDFTLQPVPPPAGTGFTAAEKVSVQNVIFATTGGRAGDAGSLSDGLSAQVDLILRQQTNAGTKAALTNLKRLICKAQWDLGNAVADLIGTPGTPAGQPRSFYVQRAKDTIAGVRATQLGQLKAAADACIAAGAAGSGTATMQRFKDIALAGVTAKLAAFDPKLAYADPYPPGRSPGGGHRITIIGPHGDFLKCAQWLTTARMRLNLVITHCVDAYGGDEPMLPGYENTYQRFKFTDLVMRKLLTTAGNIVGMQFSGYSGDAFFRILQVMENMLHGGGGPTVPENDCSPDFCHGLSYDFNNLINLWTLGDRGAWATRPKFQALMLNVMSDGTECWQATDTACWYFMKFPECETTGGCA